MVKELTSFLRKKTGWRLAAKAALAAVALWFLVWAGFSFWPLLIFFSAMLAVYFSESPERRVLRSSFWLASLLSALGLAIISVLPGGFLAGLMSGILILIFGLIIFGVSGLVNLFFRNRTLVYNFVNTALAVLLFLLVFYLTPDFSPLPNVVWFMAIFFGAALLIKEALVFEEAARGRNLRITAWSLSLLIAEIAAFAALLPLGFVNAAAFLALFYILSRDIVLAHLRGLLNLSLVFREVTIFAVVLTLIFATVAWVLP